MALARSVAYRVNLRAQARGAVVVKEERILATSYNGSIARLPHCVRTAHAELNAITQAARHGIATVYTTASPS